MIICHGSRNNRSWCFLSVLTRNLAIIRSFDSFFIVLQKSTGVKFNRYSAVLVFDNKAPIAYNYMIMRIGLISDTHIAWEQRELPAQVMDIFQGVDLILHAGDIYAHHVLDELEKIAPVMAALGDDDYRSTDPRIKEIHMLELEGQKLWLVHEGPPSPMSSSWLTSWWQNRISPEEDKYGKPDIIVSGHEHRTLVERCDGVLYVNPGSPTVPNYRWGLGTVGILELNAGEADVSIIQLQ